MHQESTSNTSVPYGKLADDMDHTQAHQGTSRDIAPGYVPPHLHPTYMGNQQNGGSPPPTYYQTADAVAPAPGPPEDADEKADDVFSIHKGIQTSYKDIFLETKDTNSFPFMTVINEFIFKYTQLGLYRVLTLLVGIKLSIIFGIIFGLSNFILVWLVQPGAKLLFVFMRMAQIIFRAAIRAFLDPCFQSIGQHLSFMRGTFKLDLNNTNLSAANKQEVADVSVQRSVEQSGSVQVQHV